MDLHAYAQLMDRWESLTAEVLSAAGQMVPGDPTRAVALGATTLQARVATAAAMEITTRRLTAPEHP